MFFSGRSAHPIACRRLLALSSRIGKTLSFSARRASGKLPSSAASAVPILEADPRLLRRGLLDNGYIELPVDGAHAVAIDQLPPIHKDPFDRILVAQSIVEGLTLMTADEVVGRYPGPIRLL
jgi:hypothetical protein